LSLYERAECAERSSRAVVATKTTRNENYKGDRMLTSVTNFAQLRADKRAAQGRSKLPSERGTRAAKPYIAKRPRKRIDLEKGPHGLRHEPIAIRELAALPHLSHVSDSILDEYEERADT
jgi:hypothetical protein